MKHQLGPITSAAVRPDAQVIQWINDRLAADPDDEPTVIQVAMYGRYACLEYAKARLAMWGRDGLIVGWPWKGVLS